MLLTFTVFTAQMLSRFPRRKSVLLLPCKFMFNVGNTMHICEKTQIRMSGILFSLLFMRPGKQVGDRNYIKDVTEFLKSFWQMLLTSFLRNSKG